jgi:hypothetical protein
MLRRTQLTTRARLSPYEEAATMRTTTTIGDVTVDYAQQRVTMGNARSSFLKLLLLPNRVALERFRLLYLLSNNFAFRNAGWARSKRCHMLPDPVRSCTFGCFRCRLTLKDADCYYIVVPGVQNIICYETNPR